MCCADYRVDCDGDTDGDGNRILHRILTSKGACSTCRLPFLIVIEKMNTTKNLFQYKEHSIDGEPVVVFGLATGQADPQIFEDWDDGFDVFAFDGVSAVTIISIRFIRSLR